MEGDVQAKVVERTGGSEKEADTTLAEGEQVKEVSGLRKRTVPKVNHCNSTMYMYQLFAFSFLPCG